MPSLTKRVISRARRQNEVRFNERCCRYLKDFQGRTPTLAFNRFLLISRCTRRAHAAFQLIEKPKLSLQSIIGATENFQSKSFISLIYFGATRSSNGLGRLENPASASLDVLCLCRESYPSWQSKVPNLHSQCTHGAHESPIAHARLPSLICLRKLATLPQKPFPSPFTLQRRDTRRTPRTTHVQPKLGICFGNEVGFDPTLGGVITCAAT
jgi:hypothetical protein